MQIAGGVYLVAEEFKGTSFDVIGWLNSSRLFSNVILFWSWKGASTKRNKLY